MSFVTSTFSIIFYNRKCHIRYISKINAGRLCSQTVSHLKGMSTPHTLFICLWMFLTKRHIESTNPERVVYMLWVQLICPSMTQVVFSQFCYLSLHSHTSVAPTKSRRICPPMTSEGNTSFSPLRSLLSFTSLFYLPNFSLL